MDGKVIVVTGASGALGKVVAETATARGARVAGIDHAAAQIPATPTGWSSAASISPMQRRPRQAIDAVVAHFGRLDALINIAGGFAFETVADGDPKTWQRMYALNVRPRSTPRAPRSRISRHRMRRASSISARSARSRPAPAWAPMPPPRPACIASPRRWPPNTRARSPSMRCCRRPSTRAANRASMPKADFAKWVTPQELADVILFLASDAASAVTGALLPVSGRV